MNDKVNAAPGGPGTQTTAIGGDQAPHSRLWLVVWSTGGVVCCWLLVSWFYEGYAMALYWFGIAGQTSAIIANLAITVAKYLGITVSDAPAWFLTT